MKKLLIIILTCFSFSTNSQLYSAMTVDNEFVPYVQDFKLIVNNKKHDNKVKNISILFDDIKKDGNEQTLAYCQMMFTDNPVIYVDRKEYYSATPMSREFTLLHEMGHCICSRFHTEQSRGMIGFFENILFHLGIVQKKGYLPDGCPSSLMHPYEFSESCMMSHYFYYIDEFKQGCQ